MNKVIKEKFKKKLLLGLVSFLMPLTITYAAEITLNCPKEISKGSEFSCTIAGNSETPITSISAKLHYQGDANVVNITNLNTWQGDTTTDDLKLYLAEPVSGSFDIAILKFKNTGDGNFAFNLDSIVLSDEKYQEFPAEAVSTQVRIKNDLTIETPDVSDDDETVDNSNTSNNPDDLDQDDEPNISKEPVYLLDLIIQGYEIDFDKETFIYNVTIDEEENTLDIIPLLENSTDQYEIIGADNLLDGSLITITVTSEEGNSQNYLIKISKTVEEPVQTPKKDYSPIFIAIIVVLLFINIYRLLRNNKNNKTNA